MSTVVVVVCLLGVPVITPPALAKFSSSGSGSGRARAVLVAAPAAPTAVFGGIITLVSCRINVSWTPAAPAGRSYTLYRVINGSSSVVMAASATATDYTDTFLLSILLGSPSYFLRSTLVGTTWFEDSAITVVHC